MIPHTGHDLGISCRTYAHQAGWGVEPLIRLDDHERAHVYQYMVLGPLYLPVYLLCGGVSAQPFERAADHFARFGWLVAVVSSQRRSPLLVAEYVS